MLAGPSIEILLYEYDCMLAK